MKRSGTAKKQGRLMGMKRARETGSYSPNAYQGHRSEMIATFFFSGFGTVIPVPRPADTGIDLYCTVTERAGKKAFPTHHFTVQIKSDTKPIEFPSQTSIETFIRHPLPFFLCIVDKKKQTLRVYSIDFRFNAWINHELPTSVRVVQRGAPVKAGNHYLSSPFIDAKFADIADSERITVFKQALLESISIENENLFRVRMGIREFLRLSVGKLN